MEHIITSMITFKYSITASWDEVEKIMNEFFYQQVYKGNKPEEFCNRPTILEQHSLCSLANNNFAIAYQIAKLENSVEKSLTNTGFLRLYKANLLKNLRRRYEDGNYDQIQDLKILDHVILSREDRNE